MEQPFFSVVIFTKNRPYLAVCALQSVLQQTFTDFEVIVSDNDDTDQTAQFLSQFDDPRIRYHRTNGKLSMPDNWEYGLSLARGRYVTSLSDRIVLKSYALHRIKCAIDRYGKDVYVWGYDMLDAEGYVYERMRPSVGPRTRIVSSRRLFDYFLHQSFGGYTNYLPKGLNSCCSNAVLQEMRLSPVGRVCPPVNPDHTMAFLTLAHRPHVVLLNQTLYVWHTSRLSNGASLIRGGETAQRFLRDLGMSEVDLSREVPIKTVEIHNSVCNDLLRLKRIDPERFRGIELDMFYYFVVCWLEIENHFSPQDPLYTHKMAAWSDALAKQSPVLQHRVGNYFRTRHPLLIPLFQTREWWIMKQKVKQGMRKYDLPEFLRRSRGRRLPAARSETVAREQSAADVLDALLAIEARERRGWRRVQRMQNWAVIRRGTRLLLDRLGEGLIGKLR